MLNSQHINDFLPPSIQQLIAVIGHQACDVLIEQRGGLSVCVPKKVSDKHWLNKAIGAQKFALLVDTYKGETIEIANCKRAMQQIKIREVVKAKAAGASTNALAQQYNLTARRIRMIAHDYKHPPFNPQDELF